jgi:hypothetical protein
VHQVAAGLVKARCCDHIFRSILVPPSMNFLLERGGLMIWILLELMISLSNGFTIRVIRSGREDATNGFVKAVGQRVLET